MFVFITRRLALISNMTIYYVLAKDNPATCFGHSVVILRPLKYIILSVFAINSQIASHFTILYLNEKVQIFRIVDKKIMTRNSPINININFIYLSSIYLPTYLSI